MKTLYPQNLSSVVRGFDQNICYGRLTTAPESRSPANSSQPESFLASSQPSDGCLSPINNMDLAANQLGQLMADALTASIYSFKSDLALRA